MTGPGPVESSGGGWTPETVLAHLTSTLQELDTRLTSLGVALEDRLTVLIEANNERYQQRFLDAQTAVNTALSAAEKAVTAALSAAKEAVVKAEVASEKRFEGVNEFRSTLADQQRTLIPRVEAELRLNALEGKFGEALHSLEKKVDTAIASLQATATDNAKRIAENRAHDTGVKEQVTDRRATSSEQRLVIGLIASLVVSAITVIALLLKQASSTP